MNSELFSDNFDKEVKEGLKSLKTERENKLNELEETIKQKRLSIGRILAGKNLYEELNLSYKNGKYNTKQNEEETKYRKTLQDFDEKSEAYKKEIRRLEYEIEKIDLLLKE